MPNQRAAGKRIFRAFGCLAAIWLDGRGEEAVGWAVMGLGSYPLASQTVPNLFTLSTGAGTEFEDEEAVAGRCSAKIGVPIRQ